MAHDAGVRGRVRGEFEDTRTWERLSSEAGSVSRGDGESHAGSENSDAL
jgi:hypothetical protein